jgi:hypothetical protein
MRQNVTSKATSPYHYSNEKAFNNNCEGLLLFPSQEDFLSLREHFGP